MANNMSLKKKSMLALGCYVCFLITIIGSVTYYVVQSPICTNLENNLDLRLLLLLPEIDAPLNHSLSTLHALVGVAVSGNTPENIQNMLSSVLKESDDIIISGIWPEPNTFISSKTLACNGWVCCNRSNKSMGARANDCTFANRSLNCEYVC